MKKKLLFISILCFSIMLFAGCSKESKSTNSNDGVTEITLWHMEEPPNRVLGFKEVIDRFNEQNPDIKVIPEVQSWDDAYTKIPASIQSGNGPELLFTLPDYTTLIKELGVVQPVDDIVQDLNEKYKFIDSTLEPYEYEDHIWAVPAFSMIQVLWYRKDLFEEANLEAPTTWNELTEAAEILTKGDVKGIALPASKSLATDQVLYSFLITAGAKDIIDENNNITFDTPETVKAYEKYTELLDFSPVDSNTYTWGEPQALFNAGKAAMAIEKGQYLATFEEESGLTADQLGITPVPVSDTGELGSIQHSNGIMVLTEDEKKQAAIKKFFEFLYEPENYVEFINAEPGLFLPVTEAASDSIDYWNNPVISKYEEQVKVLIDASKRGYLFGFTDGVSTSVGKISGPNILAQTLEEIVSNGKSVEEAVKIGQEKMEQAVE